MLQEHLPVRTDGLLSLTLAEAMGKTIGWYKEQLEILRNKAAGLGNIRNGLWVSEDPAMVGTAKAEAKNWFERLGLGQIEFAYVPMTYIP